MNKTESLLESRKPTHGEYAEHAGITQALMDVLSGGRHWDGLPPIIRESLHMIAHKLARVVVGNAYLADHWDDIAGYATLVSQRVEDGKGLRPEYVLERGRPNDIQLNRAIDALALLQDKFGISIGVVTAKDGTQTLRVTYKDGNSVPVATTPAATAPTAQPAPKNEPQDDRPAPKPRPTGPGTPEDGGHHARQPLENDVLSELEAGIGKVVDDIRKEDPTEFGDNKRNLKPRGFA